MKILIVDDHPLIQEALQHVLAALDPALELIQAQDASEAHAALSREPDTDLILLDLALPGSDGFELLGDLRRDGPAIPGSVHFHTPRSPPTNQAHPRWARRVTPEPPHTL